MALQISKVALAAGRLTSAVIDIVLLVFLFTLTDSFNQPESIGVGEGAVIIAGIADVYDLVTLFDWTEKVAETSMVAIGDAFGIILAVVGVALMGTQDYPPADAPWRQDWMAAFGLLILFIILHAALGFTRGSLGIMSWREQRKLKNEEEAAKRREVELTDVEPPAERW